MKTNNYPKLGLALTATMISAMPVVAQPEEPTCKVQVEVELIVPTCGDENGTVIFHASEGITPFLFYLNGEQVPGEYCCIGTGTYTWYVVDQEGCDTSGEFVLACEDNCAYRTQTQGGWGAAPNGNNPGAYLHNNFSAAFPGGVTIGCTRTLSLTTAQAVTDFLPSGTGPKMLNASYTNPGGSYRNVLAGQLVAAKLSVGFDSYDAGFGASDGLLGDLEIASGTFAGMTVSELIAAADAFIGNCASSYSASQLNAALTDVNESFVDGGEQSGEYLLCGGLVDPKSMSLNEAGEVKTSLYPMPALDILTVNVIGAEGMGRFRVMDTTGRLVADMGQVQMVNGSNVITLDVNVLPNGLYLLAIELDGKRVVERFAVQR